MLQGINTRLKTLKYFIFVIHHTQIAAIVLQCKLNGKLIAALLFISYTVDVLLI